MIFVVTISDLMAPDLLSQFQGEKLAQENHACFDFIFFFGRDFEKNPAPDIST
jgi:hypothetical protein